MATKKDLTNRLAQLKTMDWFVAGDITLNEMSNTFDRIKSNLVRYRFTKSEMAAQIEAIEKRHKETGVMVMENTETDRESLINELRTLDNPNTCKSWSEREKDDARIKEICEILNIEFAEDVL